MWLVSPRSRGAAAFLAGFCFVASVVGAQPAPRLDHSQPEAARTEEGQPHRHQMPETNDHDGVQMILGRQGSGTSWLPDETPMSGVHHLAGRWTLSAHGNGFLQYLHDGSKRGSNQAGSLNWVMGMAQRDVSGGRLTMRAMVSLEPWTIRGCGYPDLLASGEVCGGAAIHDRQHPHDLFMEIAAIYARPIVGSLRFQAYAAPVGEPALGPVAFPHRLSAMPNPLAPITHHWFDGTHVAFGVLTGGVHGRSWKAETSLFNGREPDDRRTNFEMAALDSWSGRVWYLPTKRWSFQASSGRLKEAEAAPDGHFRTAVVRSTASATYHRSRPGLVWATTTGWGRNQEEGASATNAFLIESSATVDDQHVWFGRFEWSEKSGHDLAVDDLDGIFHVTKAQAGYTRSLARWHSLKPGLGGSLSVSLVPESLKTLYGGRANLGLAVFLVLRPAAHET